MLLTTSKMATEENVPRILQQMVEGEEQRVEVVVVVVVAGDDCRKMVYFHLEYRNRNTHTH